MKIRLDPEDPIGWAVLHALRDGEPIDLLVTPEWREPLYEVGDRVQVEADDGWMWAEITGVSRDYIKVKYGPRGRFTTSLDQYSVRASHFKDHPMEIEVAVNV